MNEIRTGRLVITDDAGRERIVLGTEAGPNPIPGIAMLDQYGGERFSVALVEGSGPEDDTLRLALSAGDMGPQLLLAVSSDGGAEVTLSGSPEQHPGVLIELSPDGLPRVTLFHPSRLTPFGGGDGLPEGVTRTDERPMVVVGCNRDGSAYITIADRDGANARVW